MAHRLKNHRAQTVNEPGKQGQHRPSTKQPTVARRKYGGITQAAAELLDRPQCIQGSQTFGNMVIQKVGAAGRTGEYGLYKEKHSPMHGAEHTTAFLPSPPPIPLQKQLKYTARNKENLKMKKSGCSSTG